MPDSVISSCPIKGSPNMVGHHSIISNHNNVNHPIHDDGGNQSDSSNSNSSLVSSPRYNERHPRVLESVRKKSSGRVYYGSGGLWSANPAGGSSSNRGSFAVLGSRTSLPPLDENNPLDVTESQLALNFRRATRSTSWSNHKILNAIDGLTTLPQEVDPCLALAVRRAPSTEEEKDDGTFKSCSPRQTSFERFVLPKSISNSIMKSRSSGSVNPLTSNQNRENSCYNFLSGIREDEDEEQPLQQEDHHHHPSNGKRSTYSPGSNSGGGARLTVIAPTSIPMAEAPLPDEIQLQRTTGGSESMNHSRVTPRVAESRVAEGTAFDAEGAEPCVVNKVVDPK